MCIDCIDLLSTVESTYKVYTGITAMEALGIPRTNGPAIHFFNERNQIGSSRRSVEILMPTARLPTSGFQVLWAPSGILFLLASHAFTCMVQCRGWYMREGVRSGLLSKSHLISILNHLILSLYLHFIPILTLSVSIPSSLYFLFIFPLYTSFFIYSPSLLNSDLLPYQGSLLVSEDESSLASKRH
jgi:hypothetical protein